MKRVSIMDLSTKMALRAPGTPESTIPEEV